MLGGWIVCAMAMVALGAMALLGCVGQAPGEFDMGREEVLSALDGTFGTDFSGYVEDANGVRDSSMYYADLTASEGSEDSIEQVIVGLCGKGVAASSRRRSVIRNAVAGSFDRATLLTEYDFMRSGRDGAKTASTTVITATVDGRRHVFVFGQ